jgi:hypothetical protein
MQAAFQIAENYVCRLELVDYFPERLRGIGDVHQIDVASQNQLLRQRLTSPVKSRRRARQSALAALLHHDFMEI